jgi:hypothetical protein
VPFLILSTKANDELMANFPRGHQLIIGDWQQKVSDLGSTGISQRQSGNHP